MARKLGFEDAADYQVFRGALDTLDSFYEVFLHQDYRAFLLSVAKLPSTKERDALNKRYEFVIMSLTLQKVRSRALLFARDYSSVFIPRKSIQELRTNQFRERAQTVFPNRLIRLHESIVEKGEAFFTPETIQDVLLQDIPFPCPEYLELLFIYTALVKQASLETLYDLCLPLPGLKEGLPAELFQLILKRLQVVTALNAATFVQDWARLLRHRERAPLHPHLEPYIQYGMLAQDLLKHRSRNKQA